MSVWFFKLCEIAESPFGRSFSPSPKEIATLRSKFLDRQTADERLTRFDELRIGYQNFLDRAENVSLHTRNVYFQALLNLSARALDCPKYEIRNIYGLHANFDVNDLSSLPVETVLPLAKQQEILGDLAEEITQAERVIDGQKRNAETRFDNYFNASYAHDGFDADRNPIPAAIRDLGV